MSDLAHLEALIDRIYEAGLVPSLWPSLLGELGAAVGGNGGFLFGVRDGYVSAVNSVEYDQTVPMFLNDGWSERDPLLPRAIALNRAGFVTDYDLVSEEEIATNDVYCNFYRKHGIGYRAGTIIPMPSGDSIAIVLPRHQDRGPVPQQVVQLLDGLRPHLARASLAANRLGFEQARAPGRQAEPDDALVVRVVVPADQSGLGRAVHQSHRAVVAQEQRRGDVADRRVLDAVVAADREEELVLGRREAGVARPFLAPVEEPPELGAEREQVAVVGVVDPNGLMKPHAFVVPREQRPDLADELKAFVRDRLEPYKHPRVIRFMDALPRR